LAYGKEVYKNKCHKNTNFSIKRQRWEEYITQKYGNKISFGTIIYRRKDNVIYKYRPLFFTDLKTKIIKCSCLNERCEGKGIFDFKREKFEETNKHSLSKKEHELFCHPKNYEFCEYFSENPECNTIQILREYKGKD